MLHLARIAAAERRTSDLDALVERVLASSPAGDRALSARALRAFTMGNQIEQARVASAMGGARALAVGIAFTDIVLYARELTAARRLARLMAKVVRSPEERALCHIVLAHLELARGRRAAAWRELRAVSQHDAAWGLELRGLFALMPFAQVQPDDRVPLRDELRAWDASRVREHRNQVLAAHNGVHDVLRAYLLGALAAIDRDERDAESQANALEHMAGSDSRGELASALARAVLAHAARAANRSGDALSLLEAPAPAIWYQLTLTSPFFSQALERFTRAELLLDAGRLDEAAAWFRTLGEGSPYEVVYLAPAFRGRAASAERAGKSRAAADYAARAAALWGGDEPGGR
jgi:hypothetical protein